MEDVNLSILSDITTFMKYAKFNPDLSRREIYSEIVDRNKAMHVAKFPNLADEIEAAYKFVYEKKVLPSMRSMQFAGKPIEVNPSRIYNCFGKETSFITDKGVASFSDFKDGDEVCVLTHLGNYKKAIVKNYGKQQLHNIDLTRCGAKKTIRATKNHRWILKDGRETTDLKEGDSLIRTPNIFKNFVYEESSPQERLYWAYGYVYGDGTKVKDANGNYKYSMVRLCGEEIKYQSRFEELGFSSSSSFSISGDVIIFMGKYLKDAPSIEKDGVELVRAFVNGYLCADGHKNPDLLKDREVSPFKGIQSSDVEHISFIDRVFESVGIYIVSKEDLTGQVTNFGIRPTTARYNLNSNIGRNNTHCWSVKNISTTSVLEDVWCLEVEDDHSFVLSGGIPTGNCCALPIDNPAAFSEIMFLLLGGTGVGYSVQRHHIRALPEIRKPIKTKRYLIGDSIEGWADAVKMLMNAYFYGKPLPKYDFSDIREKGEPLLTSGGKAPGPEPLKDCLHHLQKILDRKKDGEKLSPIEAHDMCCYIADAVLAGGIRRAACISLFSIDDEEMLTSKFGDWSEKNPQRARANNSAVVLRHKFKKKDFKELFAKIKASGSGEPGIYLTNNAEWMCNPCCEIALRPFQMCNLVEINMSNIESQEDLNARAKAATFIATLQASYTDFHYLRPIWKETTEKEALIGVSGTGIASGEIFKYDTKIAAEAVSVENERVATLIGINKAARMTCVKPSGTTSLVLGTSSGIHPWYDEHYLRRIRVEKSESIYKFLSEKHPKLVEDDFYKPTTRALIKVPVKAPKGAVTARTQSAIELLDSVKWFHENWIKPGHRDGDNTHNVSATIYVKKDEWDVVADWMWSNKDSYNGLTVYPYDDNTYVQAPHESITEEQYNKMSRGLKLIDMSEVTETEDKTDLTGEIACAGGVCALV